MTRKKINIVVGFTPYHAYFASKFMPDLDGDTYCLFTKSWPQCEGYKRISTIAASGTVNRALTYLWAILVFSYHANKAFRSNRSVNVYVPHPRSIFTNIFFWEKRVETVNVYEDGILNYYDVDATRFPIPIVKRMLAPLVGLRYRKFTGHLTGVIVRTLDCAFLSRPSCAVNKSKIRRLVKVEQEKNKIEFVPFRVLFLDQRTDAFFDSATRAKILLDMFNRYPVGHWEYCYKGHHDFDNPINGMIHVKQLVDKSYISAEELIPLVRPQVVVSFASSALINIRSLYENVECVSLSSRLVPICIDGVPTSLSTVFESADVICR